MSPATLAATPDADLLAIVLGTSARGQRPEAAARIVHDAGGLAMIAGASMRELAAVGRLGRRQAERLAAAFELGRRAMRAGAERVAIGAPHDIHALLAPRLVGVVQEVFFVVGLDVRNGLVDAVEVARGSVASVEVHPREVFRPLIRMAAAAGVLVHNHPSGDPTPSDEDVILTRRMKDAGSLLGVPVIDHVVIAGGQYRSIGELGS